MKKVRKKPNSHYHREGSLTEKDVVRIVEEKLKEKGYIITKSAFLRNLFVDISAYDKGGNMLRIEAKGISKEHSGDFLQALGQILLRIDISKKGTPPPSDYFIALPDEQKYRNLAKKLSIGVRVVLKLGFLFINENGEIFKITPNMQVESIGKGRRF